MTYILLDIDNCISDDEWRIPYIKENDWEEYHSNASLDKASNLHVVLCAQQIGADIIVVTGRPEQFREQTASWLILNGVIPSALLMRPNDSKLPSPQLKRELIEGLDLGKCYCAYDDRQDVIDMYRSIGLKADRIFIHETET